VQWKGFVKELERCFAPHYLMNEIGIIYFQYWEALDVKMTFLGHLVVLKVKLYHFKAISICDSLVVVCWIQHCLTTRFFFIYKDEIFFPWCPKSTAQLWPNNKIVGTFGKWKHTTVTPFVVGTFGSNIILYIYNCSKSMVHFILGINFGFWAPQQLFLQN